MARILGAIHLAFSIGDDGPIGKLEDVSRPFLRGYEMDIEPDTAVEQRERIAGLIERLWKESASAPDPESMAVRILLELDRAGSPLALKIAQAGTVISQLRPGTRARRDLIPAIKDAVKKAIVEEVRGERSPHRGDSVGERLLRRVLTVLGLRRAGNQFTYKDMRSKRAGAASPGADGDDSK